MHRTLLFLLGLTACRSTPVGEEVSEAVIYVDCPDDGETEDKPEEEKPEDTDEPDTEEPEDSGGTDTGSEEDPEEPTEIETITVIYTLVTAQILENDGTILYDECGTYLHLREESEGSGLWQDPAILSHGTALMCGGASLELSEFYVDSSRDDGDTIRGNVITSVIDGSGVFTVYSLSFETTGSMNLEDETLHLEPVADPLTYTSIASPENPDYQVVFTATAVDFYEVVVESDTGE